jgi:hypothetical protein
LSPRRRPTAFRSLFSRGSRVAEPTEFILAIRREVLRSHIGVAHQTPPVICRGDNAQSHNRDWNTVFRRNSSVPVRARRGVASVNHRTCSKFLKGLAPL